MDALYRVFIAIRLPEALLKAVERLQQKLQQQPGGTAVSWTKIQNIHLTLEFLGNAEAARIGELVAALKEACHHTPFSLRLENLGCFPTPQKANVIWVGIEGELDRLKALQAAIHENVKGFGDHQEEREYQPHLTIGRIKRSAFRESRRVGALVQAHQIVSLGGWTATAVYVMRSELQREGPVYSELACVNLG